MKSPDPAGHRRIRRSPSNQSQQSSANRETSNFAWRPQSILLICACCLISFYAVGNMWSARGNDKSVRSIQLQEPNAQSHMASNEKSNLHAWSGALGRLRAWQGHRFKKAAVLKSAAVCEPKGNTYFPGGERLQIQGSTKANAFVMDAAWDCCDACALNGECSAWRWCPAMSGCTEFGGLGGPDSNKAVYQECTLMSFTIQQIVQMAPLVGKDVVWTSGMIYDAEDLAAERKSAEALQTAARENLDLPIVFMDIAIKGKPVGRIEYILYADKVPKTAENFRALCTGEKGNVPAGQLGAGMPLHFKGGMFYLIIDGFINQGGPDFEFSSIYGKTFDDERAGLLLSHNRTGLLSMANSGPNTNSGHFSIMMAPAPYLDRECVIFGEVLSGFSVAREINALAKARPDDKIGREGQVVIADCGQLRAGKAYVG